METSSLLWDVIGCGQGHPVLSCLLDERVTSMGGEIMGCTGHDDSLLGMVPTAQARRIGHFLRQRWRWPASIPRRQAQYRYPAAERGE